MHSFTNGNVRSLGKPALRVRTRWMLRLSRIRLQSRNHYDNSREQSNQTTNRYL